MYFSVSLAKIVSIKIQPVHGPQYQEEIALQIHEIGASSQLQSLQTLAVVEKKDT